MSQSENEVPFCRSYWSKGATEITNGVFSQNKYQALVIGGGFAGLSSAIEIKKKHPDWQVGVLEAETMGSGASGRSAGWLVNFPPLAWLMSDLSGFKLENMRFVLVEIQKTIDEFVEEFSRSDFSNSVRIRPEEHFMIGQSRVELATAKWVHQQLHRFGISSQEIGAERTNSPTLTHRNRGAITWPVCMINPYEALQFLIHKAQVAEISLVEKARVDKVTDTSECCSVRLNDGREVSCDWLVISTNGKGHFLKDLGIDRPQKFTHSYMIATETLSPSVWAEMESTCQPFGDAKLSYFCGRMAEGRILFNGCDRRTSGNESDDHHLPAFEILTRELRSRYRPLENVNIEAFWGGAICGTDFKSPVIHKSNRHPRIIFNWGHGSGSGIAMALHSGKMMADLAQAGEITGTATHRTMDAMKMYGFNVSGILKSSIKILRNLRW